MMFSIKRFISCNIHFAKLLPGEYFFLVIFNIKLSSDISIFIQKGGRAEICHHYSAVYRTCHNIPHDEPLINRMLVMTTGIDSNQNLTPSLEILALTVPPVTGAAT